MIPSFSQPLIASSPVYISKKNHDVSKPIAISCTQLVATCNRSIDRNKLNKLLHFSYCSKPNTCYGSDYDLRLYCLTYLKSQSFSPLLPARRHKTRIEIEDDYDCERFRQYGHWSDYKIGHSHRRKIRKSTFGSYCSSHSRVKIQASGERQYVTFEFGIS